MKRSSPEEHYLFVANAAVQSSKSGGFAGLNGSQTSGISIAASVLT
jgi:hypothetical protein